MSVAREMLASPTWDLLDGHVIASECIEAMAAIPDESVDSVVCDPPYGIGFMGHDWDQPGEEHAAIRSNGKPAVFASGRTLREPHVVGGREQVPPGQRRAVHPKPSGFTAKHKKLGARATDRDRGGAMEAGRYDLSLTANQRFQAWCEAWAAECLRILKPGGHLLASCGTRTYHRLACGIEDAGFEVRDSLVWLYGSGFPKNYDVAKGIDRAAGATRRVVGEGEPVKRMIPGATQNATDSWIKDDGRVFVPTETEAATEEAQQWEGWGSALKPSHEPVVVARKPLIGTIVANVLAHGTGAINIADTTLGFTSAADEAESKNKNRHADFGTGRRDNAVYGEDKRDRGEHGNYDAPGRWPPNVLMSHTPLCALVGVAEADSNGHYPAARGASGYGSNGHHPESTGGGLKGHEGLDERHTTGEMVEVWDCAPGCPVGALNAQSGDVGGGFGYSLGDPEGHGIYGKGFPRGDGRKVGFGDTGGASRFFYVAKSSRSEREVGLRGQVPCLVCAELDSRTHPMPTDSDPDAEDDCRRNPHPTVKPIDLMRWLVRMVTPPGGVLLDPFLGSGSTGCATVLEGFEFVGIEREDGSERPDGTTREEYVRLANARITWWEQHRGREADEVLADTRKIERKAAAVEDTGQLGLEFG